MTVVKKADGDKLWLSNYDFVMQMAVAKSAVTRVRLELESDVENEIHRLKLNAVMIKSGPTTRVPGINTLFVLPNHRKVLYHSDGYGLNDTVYYESAKDCGALAYKKWDSLSFEEKNKGRCQVLKKGVPLEKAPLKKKPVVIKKMEPVVNPKKNK